MYTHNLDPVLVDFGFIVIRWYSLSYIFGIILGWWFGKKIINHIIKVSHLKFNIKEFDDLITYLIISIIVGGRLGYIIFYNLGYYLDNPLDILKVWEGGMSFHGALLGIIFGTYLFSKKKNVPAFFLFVIFAFFFPIVILFGSLDIIIYFELFV